MIDINLPTDLLDIRIKLRNFLLKIDTQEPILLLEQFTEIYMSQYPKGQLENYKYHGARSATIAFLKFFEIMYNKFFTFVSQESVESQPIVIDSFLQILISIQELIENNIPSFLLNKVSYFLIYNICSCFSKGSLAFFNSTVGNVIKSLNNKANENLEQINFHFQTFIDNFLKSRELKILIFGFGDTIKEILRNNKELEISLYIDEYYTKKYYQLMFDETLKNFQIKYINFDEINSNKYLPDIFMIGLEGTTSKRNFSNSLKQPIPILKLINSQRKKILDKLIEKMENVISIALTEDCKHELEDNFVMRQKKYNLEYYIVDFNRVDIIVTNIGIYGKLNEELTKKIKKASESLERIVQPIPLLLPRLEKSQTIF